MPATATKKAGAKGAPATKAGRQGSVNGTGAVAAKKPAAPKVPLAKTKMKMPIVQSPTDGEFRWTLKARNGKIQGDSAEGYRRRDKAEDARRKVILGVVEIARAEGLI